ncbi:MAG: helix-turn-helix domain-containing protein [Proteobacteria bacterium]|jgi:HTH-type transcriptional regulator/antitoxin HipB|nr:helix-turn-helix domain-containing protein [Burkholderiaceae bacterium]MCH8855878.1 helix-turn-helix domain-containing protein [Pseudomonadota bacterium]|mmetsp:Transcript_59150/g.139334  ORF Transcript_59150/g.139334 Transcript_59150/m.139334 type:complete len:91 (-) Transcript_59150:7191-7463(-)
MPQRLVHSPEQLAQLLKATRKARRLTQGELAARLGLSANRFSELEAGLGALSVQRLFELTQVLGLELFVADAQASTGPAPEAGDTPPASW